MTQDLQQSIAKMEKKHAAMGEEHAALGNEIASMKEKLKQGDRFEFQGGECRFSTTSKPRIIYDSGILPDELPFRTKTKEDSERLIAWLTNQAILWQVAEFVNDGWVRPKCNAPGSCEVFYDCEDGRFNLVPASASNHAIFKDKEAAQRACDILNEQAEELGWVK